ncbi:alpha/beta hydrolase [Candidatus Obscuribacterales bacterium]|nr:alpha/beta hydrolase [Candidatus Obscuribacterales bacterium]
MLAPVYFVTDRVPIKVNGKISKFIDYGQALSNYSAGVRYVPVPVRDDIKAKWSELESLGWIDSAGYPAPDSTSKKLSQKQRAEFAASQLSDYDLSDSEVIGRIKALPSFAGGGNSSGELVVYVHGFYNSFEDGTAGGAEVASYFKRPVLVYCWTTPKVQVKPNSMPVPLTSLRIPNLTPKIWQSYRESEVTHQHGQDKFTALVQGLSHSFDPTRLVLVAHSMGSRVLDQALLCRYGFYDVVPEDKKFGAILFSNPDIDGKYFASHAEQLSQQAKTMRVFFVKQDGAMEVSRFLHGAHNRLGSPNPGVFAELRKRKVSMVDMSKLGKGQLGTLGHTMPSWLVANFYKYQTSDSTQQKYLDNRPNGDDSMIIVEPLNAK